MKAKNVLCKSFLYISLFFATLFMILFSMINTFSIGKVSYIWLNINVLTIIVVSLLLYIRLFFGRKIEIKKRAIAFLLTIFITCSLYIIYNYYIFDLLMTKMISFEDPFNSNPTFLSDTLSYKIIAPICHIGLLFFSQTGYSKILKEIK